MALLHKILKKPAHYSLQKTLFCWLAGSVLIFFSSSVPALEPPPAITTLSLDSGLLTIKATNMPLAEILTRICQAAGIEILLNSRPASPVSVSFIAIPLEEGLLRLTSGYSTALFYRSENASPAEKQNHNIVKILVLGTGTLPDTTTEDNTQFIQGTTESTFHDRQNAMPSDADLPRGENLSTEISPYGQTDEDSDEVQYWSQILQQNPDPERLQLAIVSLARIGSDAALSAMAIALGNKEAAVRQFVVGNLGLMDSNLSTQLLGQVLFSDPDPQIRLQALEQLAQQDNEVSQAFVATAAQKQEGKIGASARKFLESR